MADPRSEVPQLLQAAPSLGAIAIWFTGKDVHWWAAATGMLFIAIQIGYVLWKWRRDVRRDRLARQSSLIHEADDE